MNMKQSCKALICAIEGELDGRHCTEEQAAAILDHALPSLTEALARAEAKLAQAADLLRGVTNQPFINSNLVKAIDLFLAINAQAEQQEATEAEYYCKVCGNHGCVSGCHPDYYKQQEARLAEVARESLRPENQRTEPVEPLRIPHPLEAQGAQAVDERAAFEHWASDGGLYPNAVERRGDQYKLAQTHSYWQAWQARASLCIKNGESKS